MAARSAGAMLRQVQQFVQASSRQGWTDGQLLQRFAGQREESAFAAILQRHGRLVWGVCRHILHSEHDAEDAFQATFLVLARRATSIRKADSVACWLHGVAYRIATRAKTMAAKRQQNERRAAMGSRTEACAPAPPADVAARELQALLDAELDRLPGKYRGPFVLCCLEGRSRPEAARELGLNEGTVASRIDRARKLLQQGLTRHGVTLSAVLTAGVLGHQSVSAALVQPTLQAVVRIAHGQAIRAVVSPSVATLLECSMRTIPGVKVMLTVAVLLATVTAFGYQFTPAGDPPPVGWAESSRPTNSNSNPMGLEDSTHPTQDKKSPKTDIFGDPLPTGALLRLGTVRMRHAGGTSCSVFTPDSKTVIVSDLGGAIIFWDVATGKELRRMQVYQGSINALALSPDGKVLAIGIWGKVHLWDTATGAALSTWSVGNDAVMQIAFSPDGKTAALRCQGKTIELWDVASEKKLHTLEGHKGNVWCMAFAPDGKILASGSYEDSNARLWDVASGKQVRAIPAMDGYRLAGGQERSGDVLGVAFSPDGKTLATCGNGSRIRFWDPATGKRLRESVAPQFGSGLMHLQYIPDGKSLVSIGGLKLRSWDAETGMMLCQSPGNDFNSSNLAVSPDGKYVSTTWGGPHAVHVWDAATLKPLHRYGGHRERVTTVAFAGDGRTLFSGASVNVGNPTYEWDLASCKPVREFGKPPICGGAWDLAVSPDHRFLFTGGADGVHQYELATGKEVRAFKGHTSIITSLSLSADGKTMASGSFYDHTIRLWDVSTAKERLKIGAEQEWPATVALSPDGKIVVAGGFRDRTVKAWDTATGKLVREIATPHQPAYAAAFTPDGKLLAVAGVSPAITFFDTATGKLVRQIDGLTSNWVVRIAFSPDGRTLAAAGNDNVVSLWETATGGHRATFTGHTGAAHSLAFSPDERSLASGGDDTTILVWDIAGPPLAKAPADLWADLAGADAAKAHRAIWSLAAMPQQAVPLVQQHVKPAASPTAEAREQFTRLVAELDIDDFATRAKADLQLEKLGPSAEPLVRQALQNDPPIEVRRRLEKLLTRLEQADEAAWLRAVRALEVLEHAATPEARALLKQLAAGTADARLTREAKATLGRLQNATH